MPQPNSKPAWQQQLEDAAALAEQDLHRVIAYINDDVVPELRRNGIHALRAAAAELHRLATRLDDRARSSPPPNPDDTRP